MLGGGVIDFLFASYFFPISQIFCSERYNEGEMKINILIFKKRTGTETSQQVRTGKQLRGRAALSLQMGTLSPRAGGTRPRHGALGRPRHHHGGYEDGVCC